MLRDTFFTKTNPVEEDLAEDVGTDDALELPIDLVRSGDNLIVRAPMVGVDINLVSVTLGNNHLTIRKTDSPEPLDPADRVYLQECHWGELVRAIDLPLPINPDHTRATLHDGVLTVIMPLLNPHQAKLIRVKDKP
jgi:HSP20 family protein